MNWKNRLTNYNFWISIVSAVLLILQAFEFQFDIMYINEIATAVLGLLVVIGIINDPTKSAAKKESTTETKSEENTTQIEDEITKVDIAQNVKTENVANEEIISTTEKDEDKEITFPIDEENEIDVDNNENDIKNLIETISNDIAGGKNKVEQLLENFLNLLKNNEKISNISQNLENLLQDEEKVVTKIEEKHTETDNLDEIVEPNLKETVEEKFESFDIIQNEMMDEIKDENDIKLENETKTEVQQASSFNIVN